jgi:hypothetical protein
VDWISELEGLSPEIVEWAGSYESFPEAWMACERGDWMIWLVDRKVADRKRIVETVAAFRAIYTELQPRGVPMESILRRCADIVREHFSVEEVSP